MGSTLREEIKNILTVKIKISIEKNNILKEINGYHHNNDNSNNNYKYLLSTGKGYKNYLPYLKHDPDKKT